MTFITRRTGRTLQVLPADTLPLVTAGVLDPRLFDVTGLLRADARRHGPPLMVSYEGSPDRERHMTGHGGALWKAVRPLNGGTTLRGGVSRIALDEGRIRALPHRSYVDADRVARSADVKSYELTLTHVNPSGVPTKRFGDLVFGLDADVLEFPEGRGATTRLRLPEGRYHVESTVLSGAPDDPDFHTVVRPLINLDRNRSVTVDARVTEPVTVAPPRKGALPALVDLGYRRRVLGGTRVLESGILTNRVDNTFTAHVGDAVAEDDLVTRLNTQWARPDGAGGFVNTTYLYGLFWLERGRYFTGFAGRVPPGRLAQVRSRHVAQADTRRVRQFLAPAAGSDRRSGGGNAIAGWSVGIPFDPPSTFTAYLMAEDLRWNSSLAQTSGEGRDAMEQTWLFSPWQDYESGQAYDQEWNAAVLGPALRAPAADNRGMRSPASGDPMTGDPPAVARYGNRIVVAVPMYSDQAGHLGGSLTDSARTRLFLRRGDTWVPVGSTDEVGSGEFQVPARPATYRLETSARRSGFTDFSTRIKAAWTFRSARAPRSGQLVPASVVRFAPGVDERNRMAAGDVLLPLTVQSQLGKPGPAIRSLSLLMSTDDGRSWNAVPVREQGNGRWAAELSNPAGPAYVSLRAVVTDVRGNRAAQTIIRAYATR